MGFEGADSGPHSGLFGLYWETGQGCDGRRGDLAPVLPWDGGTGGRKLSSPLLAFCVLRGGFQDTSSRLRLPAPAIASATGCWVTITPQALPGRWKWGFTQRLLMHTDCTGCWGPNLSDQGSILEKALGEGRQPRGQWWQVKTWGECVRRVRCGVSWQTLAQSSRLEAPPEPTTPPLAALLCWSAGNSSPMVG